MKRNFRCMALALGAALAMPLTADAQDKLEVHGKADFVSDYIWRGFDQNQGFAVQPSLTLGYKGFSLNAWGSSPVSNFAEKTTPKEFDINLGYAYKGLTLTISDYWWGGKKQPYGYYEKSGFEGNVDGGHHFEGTVAYNFGEKFPLTLSWSTWFAGADALKIKDLEKGDSKRCFSTYINASYNISLPAEITLTPSIGFTPWEGYYSHSASNAKNYDNAAVTDISLKASKDVKVNDNFSIPVFVQATVAPVVDQTYLVAGFSLGF